MLERNVELDFNKMNLKRVVSIFRKRLKTKANRFKQTE